jgi:hypothetical protein
MFKIFIAAAALAAHAGSACAANHSLGTLSVNAPLSFATATAGAIDDVLSFQLDTDGRDFNGVLASSFTGLQTITNFAATLSGPNGYVDHWDYAVTPLPKYQFITGHAASLVSGSYSLHVTGIGQPHDSYTLDLSIAAVPEPETYALMAAGLLSVAALAKRRRA